MCVFSCVSSRNWKQIWDIRISDKLQTNLDFVFVIIYLSFFVYWIRFGTAMTLQTYLVNGQFHRFPDILTLSWKCVINLTCNKQDCLLYIVYWLLIDCLLIALDPHMFSHNGYGPGIRTQGPEAAGLGPGGPQLLGPGPGSRAHIHYSWSYVHQGHSIRNQ